MKTLTCGDSCRGSGGRFKPFSDALTSFHAHLSRLTSVRSGFTLLELLIVIAIIGLLASVVAPKLIGRIGKSKPVIARAQIESFGTALETYRLDTGEYPSQEQGLRALIKRSGDNLNWHGPYLRKRVIPDDPWGEPYIYKYPGENDDYNLLSYGKDKREGGEGEEADIVSWE